MEDGWFILHTFYNAEFKVAERLKAMDAEIFFPTYFERHEWSDRIKTVEIPYFRCYIFVRCNIYRLRKYLLVKGVAGPVESGGEPVAVPEKEIVEIKKFIEISEGTKIISDAEMIRETGGNFERKYGEVTRVRTKYLYLSLKYAEGLTICANLKEIL